MPSKVRRLQNLVKEGATIGFVAHTPGSERGTGTQSVLLKNAEVKTTKSGQHVITGRDIQLEAERGKIDRKNPTIRSFRIDRIVNGTIMSR